MTVQDYFVNATPNPSEAAIKGLWEANGDELARLAALTISGRETWSIDNDKINVNELGAELLMLGRDWKVLDSEQKDRLLIKLSGIDFNTSYYMLGWLEHHAITRGSPIFDILSGAEKIACDPSHDETALGTAARVVFERAATLVQLRALNKAIVSSVWREVVDGESDGSQEEFE